MKKKTQRMAEALLLRVYYPVSALAALDARGRVMDVQLFDTMAGHAELRVSPDAHTLLLISHHPEGRTAPYEEDLRNFRRVCRQASHAELQLYLVSEYFPCRRVLLCVPTGM